MSTEIKYHHTDHAHCWEEGKPPCGQKIEHFKCCLCEMLNPKIERAVLAEREAERQMFKKHVAEWDNHTRDDKEFAENVRWYVRSLPTSDNNLTV